MGTSSSKPIPSGLEDLKALDPEEFAEYKKAFEKDGMGGLKSKVDEDINRWKNVPVNIAVTGNSGVGKSSFINSFRGLKATREGTDEVDVDEMTERPTKYEYPDNENIALWGLPGVGTETFPRTTYLEVVKFPDYDYFLIVTATRFIENDLWLAKEVKSLKKKSFFIRTKMSIDVSNNKVDHPDLSKEQTVEKLRSAMTNHLAKGGFPETKAFLTDNHYRLDYDFPVLIKTMIEEAPKWKQDAMTLTMTTLTEDLIRKKRSALRKRIMIVALVSVAGGSIPLPEVGLVVDSAIIFHEISFNRKQFGLDYETLDGNAEILGMSRDSLKGELHLKSHLIGASVKSLALALGTVVVSEVAESVLSIAVPIIGSAIGCTLSYGSTVAVLRSLLNVFVADALAINEKLMGELTYLSHK